MTLHNKLMRHHKPVNDRWVDSNMKSLPKYPRAPQRYERVMATGLTIYAYLLTSEYLRPAATPAVTLRLATGAHSSIHNHKPRYPRMQ